MWPSIRQTLAVISIIAVSILLVGVAANSALARPQVKRLNINLASVIRADYSTDPRETRLAPLSKKIIDVARRDEARLQETTSQTEIVPVFRVSAPTGPAIGGEAPPTAQPSGTPSATSTPLPTARPTSIPGQPFTPKSTPIPIPIPYLYDTHTLDNAKPSANPKPYAHNNAEPGANANPKPYAHDNARAEPHTHARAKPGANADASTHTKPDAHAYAHAHAYTHAYTHAYAHTHAYADAYADAYAGAFGHALPAQQPYATDWRHGFPVRSPNGPHLADSGHSVQLRHRSRRLPRASHRQE